MGIRQERDSAPPGVRREHPPGALELVGQCAQGGDPAGGDRVRLVDVETVCLEHELEFVKLSRHLTAGDADLRALAQFGHPGVIAAV